MYNDIITEEQSIGDPRRDNFLRLINRRLPEALDQIRLIKNLFTQPYRYLYSNEDLSLIEKKLQYAIDELRLYRKATLSNSQQSHTERHI